jgi:hypothetical protein
MSRGRLIVAFAALAASAPVNALGGLAAPERLTHRYDLECAEQEGAFVVEERFDRRLPSRTVTIKGYTPLGAAASRPVSDEVARAANKMSMLDRVSWLCEPGRIVVMIDYLDRSTYEQAVKADRPVTSEPDRMRRTTLVLDGKGLTVETAGAGIEPGNSARSPRRR